MPGVMVDIEVWCSCGEGLCRQSTAHKKGNGIIIEPCEKCLKANYDKGYQDAVEET